MSTMIELEVTTPKKTTEASHRLAPSPSCRPCHRAPPARRSSCTRSRRAHEHERGASWSSIGVELSKEKERDFRSSLSLPSLAHSRPSLSPQSLNLSHSYLLTRVMDGKEADALGPLPSADAATAASDAEALLRWSAQLRSQVVDINRSSMGSPTGGVARFSAMVVSGNAAGVLGLGVGRGAEVSDAVRKATRAATAAARGSNGGGGGGLFFVPRAARASPLARSEAWYGGVKATVFPLPTGRGLRASPLAAGVCRLAGLTDVGVKFHGSRTRRHMVKALIRALEQGPTLADSTRQAAAAAGTATTAGAEASGIPSSATARELAALCKGGGKKKKKRDSKAKQQLQRIDGVSGEWYRK